MEDPEGAQLLSRAGNWAVVHLPGRTFPGVHVQGDTFAGLREQCADAVRLLREQPGNVEALEELAAAVAQMDAMLAFYERVLTERGFRRPY